MQLPHKLLDEQSVDRETVEQIHKFLSRQKWTTEPGCTQGTSWIEMFAQPTLEGVESIPKYNSNQEHNRMFRQVSTANALNAFKNTVWLINRMCLQMGDMHYFNVAREP